MFSCSENHIPSCWEGEKERKMEVNNLEPTGHAIVLKHVVLTSQITVKVAIRISTLFTDIPWIYLYVFSHSTMVLYYHG
jgi:hypothetical protein